VGAWAASQAVSQQPRDRSSGTAPSAAISYILVGEDLPRHVFRHRHLGLRRSAHPVLFDANTLYPEDCALHVSIVRLGHRSSSSCCLLSLSHQAQPAQRSAAVLSIAGPPRANPPRVTSARWRRSSPLSRPRRAAARAGVGRVSSGDDRGMDHAKTLARSKGRAVDSTGLVTPGIRLLDPGSGNELCKLTGSPNR
jgi:hypothetical protein